MEVRPDRFLFLDRDGVINKRLPGAYVRYWAEFEFLPGVLDALGVFNQFFRRTVIVTNQQGIGKGLMNAVELEELHQQLTRETTAHGIRIDGIYYCPDLSTRAGNCRKPAPTMALAAQQDFPEISFSHSVMVGDSASDILFGKRLGMQTVLIAGKKEEDSRMEAISEHIDLRFQSLFDYAHFLQQTIPVEE